MTHYTRHQLMIVLLVVGAGAVGLAVDHWRRAHPDLAERLETLDRPLSGADLAAGLHPEREEPLDLNRASEEQLARLPGIGPALASRIVAARPFLDVEDLRRVRGLGRATLERLRPRVVARGAPTAF
jgi:competence ComEA-like helix-hairpin-helix protein